MGIHSDWGRGRQQRSTNQSRCELKLSTNNTLSGNNRCKRRSNRSINELLRLTRHGQRRKLYNSRRWWSLPIYSIISRPRHDQPDNNTKNDYNRKRNSHNKRLYPVALALLGIVNPTAALAESVGGVSATANPIANSSGSVTNQAIQVLQGPYITNTYGNQISCQGPTANFTPYIQYSNSWKDPFERHYMQPQYNNNDFTGRVTTQTVTVKNYPWYDGWKRGPNNADGTMGDFILDDNGNKIAIEENWYNDAVKEDASGNPILDDDGNPQRYWEDGADMQIEMEVDGPDGVPDNPGQVVWEKPVRTDMSANNNFNIGLSATLSLPLDKKLQALCKNAAQTQIDMQTQLVANKRLDFEIARLKNCGELMQAGIMFHPRSPYAAICADVVVSTPPGTIIPHSHEFPRPTFSEDTTTNNDGTKEIQQSQVQANGTAADLTPMSIGNPISSSSSSSQSLSQEDPSSHDTHSSESQTELDDKESSQASSGWFRWPFSRQASPPSEVDQPAALLGGPIQLPPSQSLP